MLEIPGRTITNALSYNGGSLASENEGEKRARWDLNPGSPAPQACARVKILSTPLSWLGHGPLKVLMQRAYLNFIELLDARYFESVAHGYREGFNQRQPIHSNAFSGYHGALLIETVKHVCKMSHKYCDNV